MRAACVIAVEKAKASFEPMLEVCNSYSFTPPLFFLSILYAIHIIHSILIYSYLFYSSLLDLLLRNNIRHFSLKYNTLPERTILYHNAPHRHYVTAQFILCIDCFLSLSSWFVREGTPFHWTHITNPVKTW